MMRFFSKIFVVLPAEDVDTYPLRARIYDKTPYGRHKEKRWGFATATTNRAVRNALATASEAAQKTIPQSVRQVAA